MHCSINTKSVRYELLKTKNPPYRDSVARNIFKIGILFNINDKIIRIIQLVFMLNRLSAPILSIIKKHKLINASEVMYINFPTLPKSFSSNSFVLFIFISFYSLKHSL